MNCFSKLRVEEVKSAQTQVQMELPRVVAASLRPVVEATLRNELHSIVLPGRCLYIST